MGGSWAQSTLRALLWTARCALAAAVLAGLSLALSWLLLQLWRGGHHTAVPMLLQLGGFPVYVGVVVVTFRGAKRLWADRPGRWKAVVCWIGTLAALGGWFATVLLGTGDVDQQILHDRGVTAAGVITKAWYDQGDGASRTPYCDVRLGDGATLTVEGEGQVGRSVQVTYDPQRKTDPQLGGRPPAPGPQGLWVSRALLALGIILTTGVLIGPLEEFPADAVPPRDAEPVS